jgi:hypothetical protein
LNRAGIKICKKDHPPEIKKARLDIAPEGLPDDLAGCYEKSPPAKRRRAL